MWFTESGSQSALVGVYTAALNWLLWNRSKVLVQIGVKGGPHQHGLQGNGPIINVTTYTNGSDIDNIHALQKKSCCVSKSFSYLRHLPSYANSIKHFVNSKDSNGIRSVRMQFLTLRRDSKHSNGNKFEPFERDSKRSNGNSNHSKGIRRIRMQILTIRTGLEEFECKFEPFKRD